MRWRASRPRTRSARRCRLPWESRTTRRSSVFLTGLFLRTLWGLFVSTTQANRHCVQLESHGGEETVVRSDMSKVIVERPRKKGCAWHKPKGYLRRLRCYGDDGPPRCEGIKARWQGRTKYLNEHLGPLRRYLDKQVGRPWDKVFSEICAHIDRNSAVQDHVRDHVADYVTVHVLLIDGVPCSGAGGRDYGQPLRQFRYRPWYVCPRTG